jgi:hypothetical protein
MRSTLALLVAAISMGLVVAPAAGAPGAEQIVITLEDDPVVIEDFPDPCTGQILHGEGVQNGTIRITDLGERGHHARTDVSGEVDFFDAEGTFVGTWSFETRLIDQLPPDHQGVFRAIDIGPMAYADGTTARFKVNQHEVFAKDDVKKHEWIKFSCLQHP